MSDHSPAAAGAVLSADDIARLLPHRHPFFLLDRVTALEPGTSAEAIKNITSSDAVLAGHFPGRMIYPGVLLVECVAQLAAVVYGTAGALRATGEIVGDVADRVGYLAEIRQAKFLKPVVPGDQVVFRLQSGARVGGLISVTGQASVGSDPVLTVRLAVTERDA
ncbi:3-hydroxyacyl-[acyl-carrier-protein] dehydratase FabZ [Streptomyces hundungensis]|uniref:3-hydroxyacyl-[acyl-carrier-protein] dehydratase FabZ n=1 Tax=Streptomyces hundungensis TaxID=1077946 RepID=A0A387H4N0_9ACTN|nr:3-hydroxyacyl-ACP dehydratase FabZ [Streptomyces hundungensis]AYG78685.1 3-hydroxyacyl-[acyl-carrier-protein] dehydratase FabZ [Streptomyces hundungensis]